MIKNKYYGLLTAFYTSAKKNITSMKIKVHIFTSDFSLYLIKLKMLEYNYCENIQIIRNALRKLFTIRFHIGIQFFFKFFYILFALL